MSKKRQQLDSLIKGMQQLQLQMDSTRWRDSSNASENGATSSATENDVFNAERDADTSAGSSQKQETAKKKSNQARESSTDDNRINDSEQNYSAQQRLQQQLKTDNEREREYYRRMQYQQNELFNRYQKEAVSLSADIDRLQSRLYNAYRYPNYNSQPTYLTVPTPSNANPLITNTNRPYRVDTVYKTDTIRITDTIIMRKNDSINITSKNSPQIIPTPPVRDTIINNVFNYTSMPADVLLFDLGKATIRPMYYNRLLFIANILNQNPEIQASITGHTDNTGSAAINNKLSMSRAQNVAKYLATKGVREQQLITQSLSSVAPAVEGNTTSANSQNRRVVIQIIK